MSDKAVMGRTFKVETSLRCDYCHIPIPVGKFATQITGGPEVKAQGIFHGPRCYDAAKRHYEDLERTQL